MRRGYQRGLWPITYEGVYSSMTVHGTFRGNLMTTIPAWNFRMQFQCLLPGDKTAQSFTSCLQHLLKTNSRQTLDTGQHSTNIVWQSHDHDRNPISWVATAFVLRGCWVYLCNDCGCPMWMPAAESDWNCRAQAMVAFHFSTFFNSMALYSPYCDDDDDDNNNNKARIMGE